jgi:hypothetical protein
VAGQYFSIAEMTIICIKIFVLITYNSFKSNVCQIRVPDSPKDYVCTKFGQNPLKDVDSRVFTGMLRGNNLTR